jgi:hypothetical protein
MSPSTQKYKSCLLKKASPHIHPFYHCQNIGRVPMHVLQVTHSCQSLEENSKVHKYNTQRKLDINVKLQKTEIYKKSVINMGTKVYNNLPKLLKEIDDYTTFKKELKLFLLLHAFYSVEEYVSS